MDKQKNAYKEALEYLRALTKFGFNFGLGREIELLRRLGNPHEKMTYAHVTGTNGKGSVSSMLSAILTEAGLRPGLFTSPHIHSYKERFKIGGEDISEDDVVKIIGEMRPHIDAMVKEGFEHPTEFEVNTAQALHYFAGKGVENVVLEVGLGGEIDSTNVVKNVKVAILTNVALEHMDYLGSTLEEILDVKTGIFKKDAVVLTGLEQEELYPQLKKKAETRGVERIERLGRDFSFELVACSLEGQIFDYLENGQVQYADVFLPLKGRHQLGNASLAIRAAKIFGAEETDIRRGLAKAKWPCRLELVQDKPPVLIDAAHNDHGMAVLADYLQEYYGDKEITVVIGMLADKARQKAVDILGPLVKNVVVTKPNSPRAGDYQVIADFFQPHCGSVFLEEEIGEACKKGLELVKRSGSKGLLLITGSIYMVSDARAWLLGIEME